MATSSERIFRKVALDRLSSPEQLDRTVTLARPVRWPVFGTLAGLACGIVTWSIFGAVQTTVAGTGMLVARGGQMFDAMAPARGLLVSVAAVGAGVGKGDVVATLVDRATNQKLANARRELQDQRQRLQQLVERLDGQINARLRIDTQQRENLDKIIASSQQQREFYAAELRANEPLAARGYVTGRFVEGIREQMESAEQAEQRARDDRLRLDAEELDQRGRRDQEVWSQQEAVNATRRTVDELATRTGQSTNVTAPIAGEVVEIKAAVGTTVTPGKSILSIEAGGKRLEAVLYLPPKEGKKVAAGMDVRIEPATVKKEEFGTLVGHVLAVSEFPISREGMMSVLQNSQLVTRFSALGPPYAARVALVANPKSESGYAWSSGGGPPLKLSAGTVASAEVMVQSRAPITLVLPLVRRYIGI
jgi:HlyD family secretion protein